MQWPGGRCAVRVHSISVCESECITSNLSVGYYFAPSARVDAFQPVTSLSHGSYKVSCCP